MVSTRDFGSLNSGSTPDAPVRDKLLHREGARRLNKLFGVNRCNGKGISDGKNNSIIDFHSVANVKP